MLGRVGSELGTEAVMLHSHKGGRKEKQETSVIAELSLLNPGLLQ